MAGAGLKNEVPVPAAGCVVEASPGSVVARDLVMSWAVLLMLPNTPAVWGTLRSLATILDW